MGNQESHQGQLGDSIVNDLVVRWESAKANEHLVGLEGSCAAHVGERLFVFGGVSKSAGNDMNENGHLFMHDKASGAWSKIAQSGDLPMPRVSATMSSVGSKLYLFGGLSQEMGWFNDVHSFDTETNTWSKLETAGTGYTPRDKLASAAIGKDIYLFGGFGPQATGDEAEEAGEADEDEEWEEEEEEEVADQEGAQFTWFNELFIFNTENNTWSQPMQMNLGVPTPRAAHAMCAMNNFLVIFGGRDAEGRKNDLHIFDTESRKWATDMKVSGRLPAARSYHSATTVGKRVVVFGGRDVANKDLDDVHIFDSETRQWLQPKVEGDKIPARGSHVAGLLGDQYVVFGGSAVTNPETMQCSVLFNDTFHISKVDFLTGGAVDSGCIDNQENVAATANVASVQDPPEKPTPEATTSAMDAAQSA